ncbi:hypothetical protein [Dyadobacter tibetensis]|uniref:hypothetical protein n=1 Tax=Dyadobacter tibetensis TaxID=1211851 RepID=UPI00046E95E2|nr:hypothetical protein [Dyadobacter tibetensis]
MSILDKELFSELVRDPSKLNPEIIPQLEGTISKFPFCQISYALLAKASALQGPEVLDIYRPKAAAYALSRTALQRFVESPTERLPEPPAQQALAFEKTPTDSASFSTDYPLTETLVEEESPEWQKSEEQKKQKLIIEGFMKKNPRMPRQENDVKPLSIDLKGRLATSGAGGIDTEAYAQILTRQGKIDKAKDVYQKLILKNPEKRNYFAKKLGELNRLT